MRSSSECPFVVGTMRALISSGGVRVIELRGPRAQMDVVEEVKDVFECSRRRGVRGRGGRGLCLVWCGSAGLASETGDQQRRSVM